MKVGIIGCGMISDWYFQAAKRFKMIELASCSDLKQELAEKQGRVYGVAPKSVEELLSDPEIELVISLTPPEAHAGVLKQILNSGKHAYSEKPLGISLEDAEEVIRLAEEKGLRIGCAPDSFFGGAHQCLRKQVDDGVIGKVIAGTALAMSRGPETYVNAANHYGPGGGPMLDIGPYYVATLINTLGHVKSVTGVTAKFSETREGGPDTVPRVYPVVENTHQTGVMEFHSGALVTVIMSYDVYAHNHPNIELYGTEGGLQMTSPVFFQGSVRVCKKGGSRWRDVENPFSYNQDARSIGVADMIEAIRAGRKHRASGELAYHTLEVMRAFDLSSGTGKRIEIKGTCERPAGLSPNLPDGVIE